MQWVRVHGEVCMDSSHYSPVPVSAVRRKAVALNASERCRNINLHFVTVVLSIQFSPLSSVTNKRCFGIASRASSCLKTFT